MKQKRVYIGMHWEGSCARGILHGIRDSQASNDWEILLERPDPDAMNRVRRWRPDAAIGWFRNLHSGLEKLLHGLPVVNVLNEREQEDWVQIWEENGQVGRLAAQYFLERGFHNFAYLGVEWQRNSQALRETEYVAALREAGANCWVFNPVDTDERPLAEWLGKLPKPVAVLAHFDIAGRNCAELCRRLGFRVPDDVAILGVDNDEIFCELSRPRLSSIGFPWHRFGQAAAQQLARLLDGKPAAKDPILFPPHRIVTRESTDVLAVNDPALAAACRFIDAHACSSIDVDDVAKAAGLSRRVLERRYREHFDTSPAQQIRRCRIRAAQDFLLDTRLSINEIATRAGFGSAERFCVAFKTATGITPGAYRRQGSA